MEVDTSEGTGALKSAARPPGHARPGATAALGGAHLPRPAERPLVLIESEESGVQLGLSDLWRYRELLYFLTWRDIKVRYKQTLLGAAWVILQPLATMLLFTLVFNRFAGLDAGDVPYPLFAYAGLLLWTFFAGGVINGTNSLVNNTNLVTKVYFPRVFVPAAAVAAGLVDLAIASVILAGLSLYYGVTPTWGLVWLPVFVALAVALSLATGMLVSALTVKYRDLRHALPFALQFWMFASPVIYPVERVPEAWRGLLRLNPLTGIVEGFRDSLTGAPVNWHEAEVAAAVTLALLAFSFYLFRRIEDTFADVI